MILKIKKMNQKAIIPSYMTEFASGIDLYACLDNSIEIPPMARFLIPTGISISLPPNYEAQIRPRSGLAIKYGITILNSPGTIDADYRGEIKIILINLGNNIYKVNHGDRIAQMIISKVERVIPKVVEELDETDRGKGGFGSTGV